MAKSCTCQLKSLIRDCKVVFFKPQWHPVEINHTFLNAVRHLFPNLRIMLTFVSSSYRTHSETELFNVTFLMEEHFGLDPEFVGSKFLKKGFHIAGIKGHLQIFFDIYVCAVWNGRYPKTIFKSNMRQVHDFLMEIKSEFHHDTILLMTALEIFKEVAAREYQNEAFDRSSIKLGLVTEEEMKRQLMAEFNPGELDRLKKAFKKPDSLDAFMKNNTRASNMRSGNQNVKTEL